MFKLIKLGGLGLLLVVIYNATVSEIPQVKPALDHSVSYGIEAIQRAKTYGWADVGIAAAGLAGLWWLTRGPRKLWGAWKGRNKPERPGEIALHMSSYLGDVAKHLDSAHESLSKNKIWSLTTGPLTASAIKIGAKRRWGKAVAIQIRRGCGPNDRIVKATKGRRLAKKYM
jgi:hypothetical protein